MDDMEHPKALARIFALGRVNRTLQQYSKNSGDKKPAKLSELDIRLLKGFYTNQLAELDEPYHQKREEAQVAEIQFENSF
jgi:hypothetical protein